METSGYQMLDLEDVQFYWEELVSNIDAVFQPIIASPFSHSTFNGFKMSSKAEEPILIYKEQDKANIFSHPTPPVFERQTQTTVLMRNCPSGTKTENVADYVYRNFFE